MREFFIIAFHSLRDVISRGFFKLSTLIMSLLIIGGIFLPDIFLNVVSGETSKREYLIYIVDNKNYLFDDDREINLYARDVGDYIKGDYYFEYADEDIDVSSKLSKKEIDGYIEVKGKNSIDVVSDEDLSEVVFILDRFILNQKGHDISYPSYSMVKPNNDTKNFLDLVKSYLYPMMLMMIIYSIFIMYGQFISFSVKLENDSKITDIILTKVKPHVLILGRIGGLLLVGIIQIIYFLSLMFLITHLLNGDRFPFIKGVIIFDPIFVIKYFAYFILGFLLYGLLFNIIGNIVSKVEDLSMWIIPIIFVMSVGYFCAIINLQFPENYLRKVFIYVPFLSPFVSITEMEFGLMDVIGFIIILIAVFILMYINILSIKRRGIFKKRIGRKQSS